MSQSKPTSPKGVDVYTAKSEEQQLLETAETAEKSQKTASSLVEPSGFGKFFRHGSQQETFGHLRELRHRLMVIAGVIIVGFVICYAFKEPLFEALTAPLTAAMNSLENVTASQQATTTTQSTMIFTGVAELFFTYLKLAFIGGFFIAMPIILWEIWRFIAPGLYDNEKNIALPFLIATPIFFYLGGAFTYFIVMPLAIEFFFQFQTENIIALPSVKEYLNFFVKMVFAFGIAFELPVLLLILAKVGIVTAKGLANFRRYAVVCILISAAVLTPPDPASQLMLALPLYLLYELSIFGIKWIGKSPQSA